MIEFQSIKDVGLIDKERVVFRVIQQGEIGKWMLHCVRSRVKGKERLLTNKVYETFWFPDKPVEVGDLVVVYTKASLVPYKLKSSLSGQRSTHFFYWGRSQVVWAREEISVVFGRFTEWETHHVEADAFDDIEPS